LEQQDADVVDGRAVAVELDPPGAVHALGHHADRQAAREAAAVARRQDAVAFLHRALPAHIVEARASAAVAGQHGAGVGALDHDRNARGHVGQQHHAAVRARNARDAAHQAMLAQHRIAHAHALAGADVQQARPGERAARVGDGASGRHGDGRLGLQAQQLFVAGVEVLQRQGVVAPGAHLR
jgi:hypothetical protein